MPHFFSVDRDFFFPPVSDADEDGLLAVGGLVTPERVLEAYQKGIFPWYEDDSLPLWFSPDPRFVLFPEALHISGSTLKLLRQNRFTWKQNTAFEAVIQACATVPRRGQPGTWITPAIISTYTQLHRRGLALSAESWQAGELVGGVYGVKLGGVFFGESMFSRVPNASKVAFTGLVQTLAAAGVRLIDCQVYTTHVASLGAQLISRNRYLDFLQQWL